MRFWKRRREDEIEQLLRANRAEPRDEYVNSVLGRLETQRPRFRPRRSGRRILVATAVTALAASAAIAAGGAHVAGTSISNLVREDDNPQSAGQHQYSVEICHHTHSATNPWAPLFLRPPGAAAHLEHRSGDYVVGASGSPSTCPP
jgi:hypothetical protein